MSETGSETDGLAPRPTPTTEEPELFPGGTDSVRDESDYGDAPDEPITRDLDPEDNPAVDDATPDDITRPDDKQQEPDEAGDGDAEAPDEPPA